MQSTSPDGGECLNCAHPLHGRFCSNCGQDGQVRRLSLRTLLSDLVDELFKLELPIARTVVRLSWWPGRVAAEYIRGRRRTYTNPLKYCLLTAAVSVLMLQIWPIHIEPPPEAGSANGATEISVAWYEAAERSQQFLARYSALITLAMLPILAGLTRLFFLRSGHNFAEHYVLGLYVHGQWYLLGAPLAPLMSQEVGWAMTFNFALFFVIFARAVIDFFPGNKLKNMALSMMALFLYLGVFTGLYLLALSTYVFLQYPELSVNGGG